MRNTFDSGRKKVPLSVYFDNACEEIKNENIATMFISCGIGLLVTVFLFVVTPYIITDWVITVEYYFTVPVLGLFFLFAAYAKQYPNKVSQTSVSVSCALLFASLYTVFIMLSVFPYPETPQIFITLGFMLMPAMMIQRPRVIASIILLAEAVFLFLAAKFKTNECFQQDVFNSMAAIVFSFIIMMTTYRLRLRDYTARMKLKELSMTDQLTVLYNKTTFENLAESFISNLAEKQRCILMILDIDNFKTINDTYGHLCGDMLLKYMGGLLSGLFRKSDYIGRVGGDEFCVLIKDEFSQAELIDRIKRFLVSFAAFENGNAKINPTCSVGICVRSEKNLSYKEMFASADEALYEVKSGNKNGYKFSNK